MPTRAGNAVLLDLLMQWTKLGAGATLQCNVDPLAGYGLIHHPVQPQVFPQPSE
jgi:hypothetical protein